MSGGRHGTNDYHELLEAVRKLVEATRLLYADALQHPWDTVRTSDQLERIYDALAYFDRIMPSGEGGSA